MYETDEGSSPMAGMVLVNLGGQHFSVGPLHVCIRKRGCCHDDEDDRGPRVRIGA